MARAIIMYPAGVWAALIWHGFERRYVTALPSIREGQTPRKSQLYIGPMGGMIKSLLQMNGVTKFVKGCSANEPRHDKTNKMSVRPAKTQISPIWSESSLCAQRVAKDPSFLHADSEDSDQTWRMRRLIWVFAGRTLTLLVLSCRGSNIVWCNYLSNWLNHNRQNISSLLLY